MKLISKSILAACLLLLPLLMVAQRQVVVYRNGMPPLRLDMLQIDSIRIEEPLPEEHEAVDLGLSVLWASCNIGAEVPEAYGQYFAWGEVKPKQTYTEDNYLYYQDATYQFLGTDISGTAYDAARQLWGGDWRMPTVMETEELANRCTWTWTTRNNVWGYLVAGPSGQGIFLPAAGQRREEPVAVGSTGYYWSASVSADYPSAAYNLNFSGYKGRWSANRSYGFPIRAVKVPGRASGYASPTGSPQSHRP